MYLNSDTLICKTPIKIIIKTTAQHSNGETIIYRKKSEREKILELFYLTWNLLNLDYH